MPAIQQIKTSSQSSSNTQSNAVRLSVHQLGAQLDMGAWLFRHLECNLSSGVWGLVGRNGCGKSKLIHLLSGEEDPSEGHITRVGELGCFSQLPSKLLSSELTVTQYLGLDEKIVALRAIENGSVDERDFATLEEDWEVEVKLLNLLKKLRLPEKLDTPCSLLSGGQLALLQLHKLFESDASILLLDEPTNHLDSVGRAWLADKLQHFEGCAVIVSHDRYLLEQCQGIYHLSSNGLDYFDGGYSLYHATRSAQLETLERKVERLGKEAKAIEKQAQLNLEKAQRREAQGVKLRKSGSQPKILLDGKAQKAQLARSAQQLNQNNQLDRVNKDLDVAKKQQEQLKSQKLYLNTNHSSKRSTLVSVEECVLDFVDVPIANFKVAQGERWHIDGDNGTGKSLLLKALHGNHNHFKGSITLRHPTVYLDQHFGLLPESSTLLDALMDFCVGLTNSEAWLLLASIGFRRDAVHKRVSVLSGGEKMKLAMLMVSHRMDAPLLLLDEPDNHLDIDSKQILASALNQYQGAFMVVSHDKVFIDELGIANTINMQKSSELCLT
ncbi:ABC-F family ATP-binding cassette domain-containing protein [Vibrio sp. 188UL20-2]|uniref:ABC-F family ATP-binding cassette domain-containing protein n=2 Tax=Vibrio ulleungensis TaxID=2807619 RepID=A0ABS2HDV2_9VIBR|nr:ABC-F family ATP-binding cassette domain-containing protein [Vibrio ulleungensis]